MWKDWATNIAKKQEQQISQNSTLRKTKRQERLRRKNHKSNKTFSYYVKRLSNKYGKNCKNNKFHKILHLEKEKFKKGLASSLSKSGILLNLLFLRFLRYLSRVFSAREKNPC